MTEQEAWDLLQATYPTVLAWGDRLSAGVFTPAMGSELAVDDQDVPWAPLSQLAWHSLSSTHDHLRAIKYHYEVPVNMTLAHRTLIRGAIVGAAQAVWLLHPDLQSERLRRSRLVALETYSRMLEYVEGAGMVNQRKQILKRLAELQAIRSAAGETAKKIDSTTSIVRDAAVATFEPGWQLNQVTLEWQAGSGTTHSLVWPLLLSASTEATATNEPEVSDFKLSGGVLDTWPGWRSALDMGALAFELLDRRGT